MAVAGNAGGLVKEAIAHSVVESPARKVIIPVRDQDWEWTGVERWKFESIVREATSDLKPMSIGQEVKAQGIRNLSSHDKDMRPPLSTIMLDCAKGTLIHLCLVAWLRFKPHSALPVMILTVREYERVHLT